MTAETDDTNVQQWDMYILYVQCVRNKNVRTVDLLGSNAVMKWSMAGSPIGLSVNERLFVTNESEIQQNNNI